MATKRQSRRTSLTGYPMGSVITATWHGDILPMPRVRVTRIGRPYYSKRYRKHADALRMWMSVTYRAIRDVQTPIRVEAQVYRRYTPCHPRYGDADNIAKTILDALPCDDRWVVSLTVSKHYAPKPYAVITVEVLGGEATD